jgi:hypothetical protein
VKKMEWDGGGGGRFEISEVGRVGNEDFNGREMVGSPRRLWG